MSVESINTNVAPAASAQTSTLKNVQPESESKKSIESPQVAAVHQTEEANEQELNTAVDKLNNFVGNVAQRDLSFSVDKDSDQMVVVVKDKLTQDVIRQMPTKEALAVAKQIESMLGLILNDKA
jgi:flagellar protein FlaG